MYLFPDTELNNRYKIEEVLGHGGFGITYSALDKVLNVKVAIKEYLPRQLATRGEGQAKVSIFTGEARQHYDYGLRKFLEEARSVAQFSHHPNIVSARDYFEANDTAYMVMEYVEGVTLREYLQKKGGRIAFEEARGILMPVMDALREVHQAGMLHRDISPDNIYITTSAQVKILDFGAARYFAGEQSKSLSIILKPGYAPEEQYRSKGQQGPWTDVYSTAATLYRAITGQTPPEALDRMAEDTLTPPSRLDVAIPPAAEQALLRAFAVNQDQRFQTMGEFQEALLGQKPLTDVVQPAITEVIPEPSPEPLVKPPAGKINWAVPAILISGVVIALVLIVGTFWRWNQTKTPVTPPITKSAPPLVQAPVPSLKETPPVPQPVKTRFTKAGDGVISDSATGLEWYVGPDLDTDWNKAKAWTDSLTAAGAGWRMPTSQELEAIYQKGAGPNNMDPIFQPAAWWVWSGQLIDASSAWGFNFGFGQEYRSHLYNAGARRAFAVRSRRPTPPLVQSPTPPLKETPPVPQPVKNRFTKILPQKRIVAYYGNPQSKKMGVLGEYPKDEMLKRLYGEVKKWEEADPSLPVQPALHLVAVVAQGEPGEAGKYRKVMPDKVVNQVYDWAKEAKALLFIDIHTGHDNIRTILPRFEWLLKNPDVHLGIDPEFNMIKSGKKPGTGIGTYDAADINYVSGYLQELVKKYNLPPKVFIVHRFTRNMVTNAKSIVLRPEVQIVMNMDGWGAPWLKRNVYRDYIGKEPVEYTGFKLFYHNDTKKGDLLMTPQDLLKLNPKPIYIQYQ